MRKKFIGWYVNYFIGVLSFAVQNQWWLLLNLRLASASVTQCDRESTCIWNSCEGYWYFTELCIISSEGFCFPILLFFYKLVRRWKSLLRCFHPFYHNPGGEDKIPRWPTKAVEVWRHYRFSFPVHRLVSRRENCGKWKLAGADEELAGPFPWPRSLVKVPQSYKRDTLKLPWFISLISAFSNYKLTLPPPPPRLTLMSKSSTCKVVAALLIHVFKAVLRA